MSAWNISKALLLVVLAASATACARTGDAVKPSQAVVDGKKVYPDAKPAEDKPFILDGLLN